MGNLVGQDTGQLFLVFHSSKKAAVNVNMPSRAGKGIVNILFDNIKPELKRRGVVLAHNLLPYFVHIVRDTRVLDKRESPLEMLRKLIAQGLFLCSCQGSMRQPRRASRKG